MPEINIGRDNVCIEEKNVAQINKVKCDNKERKVNLMKEG